MLIVLEQLLCTDNNYTHLINGIMILSGYEFIISIIVYKYIYIYLYIYKYIYIYIYIFIYLYISDV